MGFFDDIGKSILGGVQSQAKTSTEQAARGATKTALSKDTYAGLNTKSFADKTRFFKKENGDYEIYFEVKQIGSVYASVVKELLARPKDIAEAKAMELLTRMKSEFTNQAVCKAVAQKFLVEIKHPG